MKSDMNLFNLGLSNIQLRKYQMDGVQWFIDSVKSNHGGILADEMGLGKTVQTICAVLAFKDIFHFKKFIIVSPLSVVNNWKNEFNKFTPNLKYFVYMGNKIERTNIRNSHEWNAEELIMITTYEYLLQDFMEINVINLDAFFMDEGHRIKNHESVLYNKVSEIPTKFKFLLTGTPMQNNFDELYNLLAIVARNILVSRDRFKENLTSKLSDFSKDDNLDGILKTDSILNKLILRRTKAEQLQHLPEKTEVVIFHGMTDLQKTLYKSILMRDVNILQELTNETNVESKSSSKNLSNILMQIRKCALHPYLFNGIEKEPFELGDHLIDNSIKLQVIDKLLLYLMPLGHKILLFSQMTKMLDIIQDYCYLRSFNYERLDGSVRSEERFAAINNFSETESTKLFLLSTRAGGQGLNLTAADTVIFVDSDFNPQVDLQAMARIHRPGQYRPCRIIRLVARYSVEEIIVSRAQRKLSMTREILGHEENTITKKKLNLKEMVCYGVDKLFSDNKNNDVVLSNEFFTSILGDTDSDGRWKPVVKNNDVTLKNIENINDDVNHIYLFDGQNYKPKPSTSDFQALNRILKDTKDCQQSKKKTKLDLDVSRPDRKITINKKKQQMWDSNKYVSQKIEINDNDIENSDSIMRNPSDGSDFGINFISGNVTNPIGDPDNSKIICHLVDNSGSWGSGGLFSAIDGINSNISIEYMTAGEMDDLKLGDCHVLPLKLNIQLALLVAQTRDDNGRLSEVKTKYLEMCFKKVRCFAISNNASIHLTRLGYKTPRFNWYSIEKLINKHFTEQGIDTFIYYFPRDFKRNSPNAVTLKLSEKYFKSIFSKLIFHFHESVDKETKRILTRYIASFDGQLTDNPMDGNITHFLLSNKMEFIEKEIFNEEIVFVKVDWVMKCISEKEIFPIGKYII